MINPKSTVQVAGHPIHPMLVPFPIAFLIGTFASDIAYKVTSDAFWARSAFILLTAALIMAVFAAIAGLIDFLSDRLIRSARAAWYHMFGNATALTLSGISLWMRASRGETGAYPGVLWISAAVVLLLVFNGWKGWELVYRHHVGVSEDLPPSPQKLHQDARPWNGSTHL